MVSINKSFIYGIGFASITWIISLYLYSQLTANNGIYNNSLTKTATIRPISKYSAFASKKFNISKRFYHKKGELVEKLKPIIKNLPNKTNQFEQELFDLGLIQDAKEQELRDEGYKVHAYNVLISNKLSLHRNIPDTRNPLCKNIKYPTELPKASIIICFYNEHNQTLLRSVHSILDRSPEHYLKEIILIDDFSDMEDLNNNLENYLLIKNLTKVKLFKTEKREGLIRARIFGAQKATGDVLIFLDSHIEVNQVWIEPLISKIQEKESNVVMPIIDIINPDTFMYSSSPLVRGGFNWGLHFKWDSLPKGTLQKPEDFTKPIKSPTMAGGLFAINRNYFIKMGEYDAGMNIWGGENLEISFRMWMCGGSLELIPCSRVGHIFRHRRPYGSPDGQDTMLYNSLRVANVWMDDYKNYFLKENYQARNTNYGDISSRIQLRKELKCHDFDWYVKNVYPELILPSDDQEKLKKKWSALEHDKFQPWHSRKRNYVNQFFIRLTNSSLCIQSANDIKTKGGSLILRPCTYYKKNQLWYQTDKNEFVLAQLLCLQSAKPNPILYKCHEMGAEQEWKHKGGKNTPIYNLGAGTCLGVSQKKVNAVVEMKLCTEPNLNTWDLINNE